MYDALTFDLQAALTASLAATMNDDKDTDLPSDQVDSDHEVAAHNVMQEFEKPFDSNRMYPSPDEMLPNEGQGGGGKGLRKREHQRRRRVRLRLENGGLVHPKAYARRRSKPNVAVQSSRDFSIGQASFTKGAYVGRAGGHECEGRPVFSVTDTMREGARVIPWDGRLGRCFLP